MSLAKNITNPNVNLAGVNLVCLSGLSFTPSHVVVSSVYTGSHTLIASANIGRVGACPAGTQVTIATYSTAGNPTAGPVLILLN